MDAPQNYLAVIKVVGIGGGGVNAAVNRMIEAGLRGVEFIAVNTDAQTLLMSDAEVKLDIGRATTRGLGPGPIRRWARAPPTSTPMRSRRSSRARTWCSSPPAKRAAPGPAARRPSHRSPAPSEPSRSASSPSFGFEGRMRATQADLRVTELKAVDTLIVVPNDRLLQVSDPNTSMIDAFRMADQVLFQGVDGITSLITTPGLISLDFADVKAVMSGFGSA